VPSYPSSMQVSSRALIMLSDAPRPRRDNAADPPGRPPEPFGAGREGSSGSISSQS
jgi:hypothetical protein